MSVLDVIGGRIDVVTEFRRFMLDDDTGIRTDVVDAAAAAAVFIEDDEDDELPYGFSRTTLVRRVSVI